MNDPLVFVIDIDGCLVGNVTPQIMLYEMINELRSERAKIFFNTRDFQSKLRKGIVRPHFSAFYKNVKKHIPNSEFFIYTASQKKWAEFLIKNIEKALNIRFNRPLFTRNECTVINGEYKKSLSNIRPAIARSLKKRYGQDLSLNNRLVMIDNTNVFSKNDQESLVLCPTYSYYQVENIPVSITENIYVSHKDVISSVFKKYSPLTNNIDSYMSFQKSFYVYYVHQITILDRNQLSDRFWYYLAKTIITKNIRTFSPKAVGYINSKVSSYLR